MMTYKTVDKINDVLAELNFLLGEMSTEVDEETRAALKVTNDLAWQIIEKTISEVEA